MRFDDYRCIRSGGRRRLCLDRTLGTSLAAGNVATEDFVNALQLQGLREDITLESLTGVAADVADFFKREMPGCVYRNSQGGK